MPDAKFQFVLGINLELLYGNLSNSDAVIIFEIYISISIQHRRSVKITISLQPMVFIPT